MKSEKEKIYIFMECLNKKFMYLQPLSNFFSANEQFLAALTAH